MKLLAVTYGNASSLVVIYVHYVLCIFLSFIATCSCDITEFCSDFMYYALILILSVARKLL